MVKHTIELSGNARYVSALNRQLVFSSADEKLGQVPSEDIGILVVDNPKVTFTHAALLQVVENGGCVVICDDRHMPAAMMLPFAKHVEVIWRIDDQLSVTRPIAKRVWQQTVRAKICAQAANVEWDTRIHSKLHTIASNVKSGDSSNQEAQAAKVYWQHWLGTTEFRRDYNGIGINSLLNYGYAIVRAAVAREIVASGLSPAIGIHHQNRSNHFCLADDLMEPLRPFVDYVVRELFEDGYTQLCKVSKQALLELLTTYVKFGEETGPLSAQIKKMVQSYVKCLQKTAKTIKFPVLCS